MDNASSDDSVIIARERFGYMKNFMVVSLGENIGYAGAANQALRYANGQIIGILNNDILVTKTWLLPLVQALLSRIDVMVVSPQLLMLENPGLVMSRGGIINAFLVAWDRSLMKPAADQPIQEHCLHPSGAAFVFWRELIPKIGGEVFDENYFAYFEDVDFGWRTWLSGFKVMYVHDSIVFHKGGGTWSVSSPGKFYLIRRNGILTGMRNFDTKSMLSLLPIWLISSVVAGFFFYRATKDIKYVSNGIRAIFSALLNFKRIWKKRIFRSDPYSFLGLMSDELLTYRPNVFQVCLCKLANRYSHFLGLHNYDINRITEYPRFEPEIINRPFATQ